MTEVDAGLAISGVFDLEPIRLGVLNDKLKLQPGEVCASEPLVDAAGSGRTAGRGLMARQNCPSSSDSRAFTESLAFERAGGDTVAG